MRRMRFAVCRAHAAAALLLSALLAPLTPAVAQQPQQPPMRIQPVKDGLWVILGSGGNVGVRVTTEGVILVDDKFPADYEEILRLVRRVTDQPVRYVINTHHHGDHSGSNESFLQVAEVIAHENARHNMVRASQAGQPRVVFADQAAVYLGGVEVRALHLGTGHTNGDAVIHFPDLRTVHGGDLLHATAPFIDYANGGSSKGWVGTIDAMLELDFDTAIPGHGGVMTRGDVVAFRDQMEEVRSLMAELIRSGVRREAAQARMRTPGLSWTLAEEGLFMQRSIPGLYDEIAAELR